MSLLIFFIDQTQQHRLTALTNLQSGGHYGGEFKRKEKWYQLIILLASKPRNWGLSFLSLVKSYSSSAFQPTCASVSRDDKTVDPEWATSLGPKRSQKAESIPVLLPKLAQVVLYPHP